MDESSGAETTGEIWPKNFKPILRGANKYFLLDESLLLALGVKIHMKQRGFKDLDHLLERHGKRIYWYFCSSQFSWLVFNWRITWNVGKGFPILRTSFGRSNQNISFSLDLLRNRSVSKTLQFHPWFVEQSLLVITNFRFLRRFENIGIILNVPCMHINY